MIFYHYTSVVMAESIVLSGLSEGQLRRTNGEIVRPIVWLTTDADPAGNGLSPVGDDAPVRPDKAAIRLRIKLPKDDRRLVSFTAYAARNEAPGFARFTALAAIHRLGSELTAGDIERRFGAVKTREAAWWLYRGTILPERIEAREINRGGVFGAYDFEADGRPAFARQGFAVVSPARLAELAALYPAMQGLGRTIAFCFCRAPGDPPQVQVRGPSVHVIIGLDDGAVLHGEAPGNIGGLVAWVAQHRQELTGCWGEAKVGR